MKNEQKEILIPFEGFYNTYSELEVTRNVFYAWNGSEKYQEEDELYLEGTPEDIESYEKYREEHYKEHEQDYAEAYARGLARELSRELDTPVTFSDVVIDSPKFYNFTTDRIFAKVSTDTLEKLYSSADKIKLAEYIKEHYSSRDGFISHYESDINAPEWQNIELYDHNQWEAVLDVFMAQCDIERYELAR